MKNNRLEIIEGFFAILTISAAIGFMWSALYGFIFGVIAVLFMIGCLAGGVKQKDYEELILMWERNKQFFYGWLLVCCSGLMFFEIDGWLKGWCIMWSIMMIIGLPFAQIIDDATLVNRHKADEIRMAKRNKKTSTSE